MLGTRGVAGVRRGADASQVLVINGNGGVNPSRLSGFDAVINCAGRVTGTVDELRQANVDYPLALANAVREAGVPRFVQVSSFSVYGRAPCIDTGTALVPESDYGRSKLVAERALAALGDSTFQVTSLRLPFMFSVTEPTLLRPLVATMLRLRVLPTVRGNPSQRSVLTYASAADALVQVATRPKPVPAVLIAADPEPLALVAIARTIQTVLGRTILIVPLPAVLARGLRPLAPGTIDRLFGSSLLAPSANMLADGTAHSAAAEIKAYLRQLL